MTMILMGRPLLAMVASSGMRHLESAVAADGEDQLIGARHLRADRRGQAEAHGAEAAGVDPEARFVEAAELRGPHLVLADVAGDDGLAAGEAIDFGHQVLRLDFGIAAWVCRSGARPSMRGSAATRRGGRRCAWRSGCRSLLQELGELGEHALHVADDGHFGSRGSCRFRRDRCPRG